MLLIYLVDHLLYNYERDNTIKQLVQKTDIFIMPSLNPDGYKLARRENANGYDLNRNFPDSWFSVSPTQPETKAMMHFSNLHNFVLSSTLHGGALVAN